ncbi:S-adenosyl-L-methionine-dependent methyltransferase [Dunaliella salina]|uniref:S-adenosyl-L-methionine-dependent methyltransferase n=1 Tax=Dunaliella salina TaxID=3046 RepID=A0ABQ7H8H7_DUNSA|nr:S-adenosyl-L-methionine-dependent methyltransferase [Dunaliella salina]|eukprot:KAF5843166.1 S-adenosyl-L-methionine-dependent methyltransferase [Dunaliella salina]
MGQRCTYVSTYVCIFRTLNHLDECSLSFINVNEHVFRIQGENLIIQGCAAMRYTGRSCSTHKRNLPCCSDALQARRHRVVCHNSTRSCSDGQASRRRLVLSLPAFVHNVSINAPPALATLESSTSSSSQLRDDREMRGAPSSSVEKDYDRFAATYDDLDGGSAAGVLGFDDLREELLQKAQGNVLEIAVGTGLNLKHYSFGAGRVEALTGVDISNGMLSQASARIARDPQLKHARISLQQADATQLPLPSASFDSVVDTFSLCVIPEPLPALREMARVLRPGGRVLLLEHARSDNPILGAYQDISASAVAATAKGCVWNQDVPALLKAAGLRPTRLQRYTAGTIMMVEAQVGNSM